MAKVVFNNYWSSADGEKIYATNFQNMEAGIQADLEERLYAGTPAGVKTGLAGSIVSTSIAIDTGGGYAGGKRYEGGESISFVGASAGTYFIYWDQSAEALTKNTTAPDTEEDLLFCSVAWNGTTTLSGLVDLRPWGITRLLFAPYFGSGTVTAGTIKWAGLVPWAAWVDYVKITLGTTGTAGPTVIDINKGASGAAQVSIFTTTAARPSCTSGVTAWTVCASGMPDVRDLAAGDILTMDIDSAGTGAQNILVQVYGRLK